MHFKPDYKNIIDVCNNIKPERLPLYEHIISPVIMEKILDVKFADMEEGQGKDLPEFFKHYCWFFKEMTYDTVSYEVCVIEALPHQGNSLMGKEPGPIQTEQDLDNFDWQAALEKYKQVSDNKFKALAKNLPEGMKAVGGVGNGVFEISEDLVGLEYLAYMQVDNPQLYEKVYSKIGDLMYQIWDWFLQNHSQSFAVCRIGDDLGYKSGTLISPAGIRKHIVPQYHKVIDLIQDSGHKFLWHSCGNIFEVMDDFIRIGIDAKHSNEDVIAEYDRWIELYSDKIGLFGGIDMDFLCHQPPDRVYEKVLEEGKRFRNKANGYALGSGNSIPDYVPVDGYLAMIKAANKIREKEKSL
jgi:uroporphyrinogen decarboxylase